MLGGLLGRLFAVSQFIIFFNMWMEARSKASILKVRICALHLQLSSSKAEIAKSETKIASRNSEFDNASAKLSYSDPRTLFVKNAASLMQEHFQSEMPYLLEVKATFIAVQAVQAAVKSSVESLLASKSTLWG